MYYRVQNQLWWPVKCVEFPSSGCQQNSFFAKTKNMVRTRVMKLTWSFGHFKRFSYLTCELFFLQVWQQICCKISTKILVAFKPCKSQHIQPPLNYTVHLNPNLLRLAKTNFHCVSPWQTPITRSFYNSIHEYMFIRLFNLSNTIYKLKSVFYSYL